MFLTLISFSSFPFLKFARNCPFEYQNEQIVPRFEEEVPRWLSCIKKKYLVLKKLNFTNM